MKQAIVGLLSFACCVGVVWCWVASLVALHRAAKARKPGVRYWAGFATMSALFRDRLYTDKGLRHATRHLNLIAGFLGFVLLSILILWIAK